jgi:hypothetical protein
MFTGLGMGCRANWERESANIPGLVGVGGLGGGHLQQRATGVLSAGVHTGASHILFGDQQRLG